MTPTWAVSGSFAYMENLFRQWLEGAQPTEIRRLLELVQEELARRGQALTYTIAPRRNPEGRI